MFFRAVKHASNVGLYVAMGAVLVLTLVIVVNVVLRASPAASFLFVEEYSAYLLLAITFLGAGYALREKAHIRVTLLVDRFPERVRRSWDIFTTSVGIITVIILLYYGFTFFLSALLSGQRSHTIVLTPLWIPRLLLVPGYLFVLLEMIVYLVKRSGGQQ